MVVLVVFLSVPLRGVLGVDCEGAGVVGSDGFYQLEMV